MVSVIICYTFDHFPLFVKFVEFLLMFVELSFGNSLHSRNLDCNFSKFLFLFSLKLKKSTAFRTFETRNSKFRSKAVPKKNIFCYIENSIDHNFLTLLLKAFDLFSVIHQLKSKIDKLC